MKINNKLEIFIPIADIKTGICFINILKEIKEVCTKYKCEAYVGHLQSYHTITRYTDIITLSKNWSK